MRIAMIGLRGIPHTYGGGEEFVRHVAPRLAAKGHEVIVYCRSGYYQDRDPYWNGVRRVFYPAPEHKSAGQFVHGFLGTVDAAIRRPDVIYIHTLPSAPHSYIPWILREKIVINVNGMDWARDKWGPIGKAYFRAAARISLHTANAIVNDSQAMRAFYLDRFGRDSYFIAYGADIRGSDDPNVVRQYGVEPGEYYLIASRMVPENHPDLIIDAFIASGSRRKLVVAGGANFTSPWVEKLRATSDPRVIFPGHIANADHVRELHCNCYAYVHGHSLGGTNPALLKALGYGNCVLALDNPFNREVLTGNDGTDYGILWPKDRTALTRAIESLDADPARAAALRARAPDRIREAYTWDFIADEYERVFRDVVEGGAHVPPHVKR